MKTRSLWYTAPKELELREIDIPEPGPHEVLVKVEACGICTWDLFIYSGGFQGFKEFPFYFGHEGVGIVERIGPEVTRFRGGERVALRESREIGAIGTGHMAGYAIQREEEVISLPKDGRKPEHWMIEPVACCVNGVDLAEIKPGERVALVGSGFMGSILLQLLTLSPASNISVFELRPEALSFAESLKNRAPIDVYDLREKPETETLAGSFDVVFETAAVEPAFRLANDLVRAGGTLAIFSWHHHDITFDFGNWHVRGIKVLNTSPAAAPDFTDCFIRSVPLIEQGLVDLEPLTTHVGAPEDAKELYEHGLAKSDGYIKGVIRWS
ncbi:MAG: zinc-dependent alcohol dehydrogenase [Spirochaetaceae bacterium]